MSESKAIKSVRFVIENTGNIIIIFDSDYDYKSLSQDLFPIMVSDNIKFYFIFDRDSLVTAHIPQQVKDFIFKPASENSFIRLEYNSQDQPIMDLDTLLEKIEAFGVDSLTIEEKNFLDNFEK